MDIPLFCTLGQKINYKQSFQNLLCSSYCLGSLWKTFKMKRISESLIVLLFLTVCAYAREIGSNVTAEQVSDVETLSNTTSEYALNHTEPSESTELTTDGQVVCDCGLFGRCLSYKRKASCYCFSGYSEKMEGTKVTCERECDCGELSESCEFQGSKKVCKCKDTATATITKYNFNHYCFSCKRCGSNYANCTFNTDTHDFRCNCLPGYESTDPECQDIDECKNASLHDCPADTDCINTVGSYRCGCKPGFQKRTPFHPKYDRCEDVNECERWLTCDYFSQTCVNTVGSYYCKCKDNLDYHEATNKCWTAKRPWRTGYIALSIIGVIAIVCFLLYILYQKVFSFPPVKKSSKLPTLTRINTCDNTN